MEIVNKRIDDVIPYENNPRKNDQAVDSVAASIREFGFRQPIILDADGVIICGHTRLKAAKKLGLETVPCVVAKDLTPEQAKAYRLADNMTAQLSEWDNELLEQELAGIKEMDMAIFGFPAGEVKESEVEEDDYIAEPPVKTDTQRGDIFVIGGGYSPHNVRRRDV